MRIEDSFIAEEHFKKIQNVLMGDMFPWYYNRHITKEGKGEEREFQFTHRLFTEAEGVASTAMSLFDPVIEKLGVKSLLLAKINCGYRTSNPTEGGWHTDFPVYRKVKTAVFYINTNNGGTKFEDGTFVDSIENRLAEFDSTQKHTGVSQTDTQVRVVLNLNYLTD